MRRSDPRAEVHVPYGSRAHAQVLRRPGERPRARGVEAGAPERLAARRRPRRRKRPGGAARGTSYSIIDALIAVVLVAVMVTALWGLGCAYQAGYANGVRYAQEFAR